MVWRFDLDLDNIWKQVVNTKYGKEAHGWRSRGTKGLWKEILKEVEWQPIIGVQNRQRNQSLNLE